MLQVTFCPGMPAKAADNVHLLRLPQLQLPLYTHSFLGFGQEAALTLASTALVSQRLQASSSAVVSSESGIESPHESGSQSVAESSSELGSNHGDESTDGSADGGEHNAQHMLTAQAKSRS